jgi:GLPGLI family protein
MKKSILLILLIILFISANAQFVSHVRTSLMMHKADTCKYVVVYTYKLVRDTIKKNVYYDRQVLEIGDSIIKYSSIYADRLDSVHYVFNQPQKQKRANKDGSDGYNPGKEAGMQADEVAIYADYYINYPQKGILTVSTGILGKEYVYEEPIPQFNWKIQSDTTTILGYKCIKATTTFRGRDYEVWFTPFIPIRKGPWKFNGLFGLILKASDTQGYFEWTAIGIEKPKNRNLSIINFDIIPKSLIRTTRKDVIKLLHKRWRDPVGLGLANLPKDFKGIYSFQDPLTGIQVRISNDAAITTKNVQLPYIPIPELE